MKSVPIVSVITSFFNAEKFISEAIESVLRQTFADWELLLVDDGSQDSSSTIAMQFARQMPNKVRYLEHSKHQNRGLSASRNLGLYRAQALYVALLDADDVWYPRKLEEQVHLLEMYPDAAMIYGHSEYWHSWTGRDEDKKCDRTPALGVELDRVHLPPTLLRACLSGRALAPCPSNLIFRKGAVSDLGGFEEEFVGLYDDQVFLAKVFLNLPVFVASQCWDRYRQHADSICAVQTRLGRERDIRFSYLRWLERYLSAQGVDDEIIWKYVRRSFWPFRHPVLGRMLRPFVQYARKVRATTS